MCAYFLDMSGSCGCVRVWVGLFFLPCLLLVPSHDKCSPLPTRSLSLSLTHSLSHSLTRSLTHPLSLSHTHDAHTVALNLSPFSPPSPPPGSREGAALHRNYRPRAAHESAPDRPRLHLRLPPFQRPDGTEYVMSSTERPPALPCLQASRDRSVASSSSVGTRCRRFAHDDVSVLLCSLVSAFLIVFSCSPLPLSLCPKSRNPVSLSLSLSLI